MSFKLLPLTYLLTSSSKCCSAHKAPTSDLHSFRSSADFSRVFHFQPCRFISASTVLLHVSFGLPLLLLPAGVQRRATLDIAVGGRRKTCPIHLHLRLRISSVIGLILVWAYKLSFRMVSGQKILKIFLKRVSLKSFQFVAKGLRHFP